MGINKNSLTLLPSVFLGGNSNVPASGIILRILKKNQCTIILALCTEVHENHGGNACIYRSLV